jgi:predicted DNA binding CopG/RHH family protein
VSILSIIELARFWDTHDLTDFEDALEEVPESVFERHAEEPVTIHLPAAEVEVVKRMAEAKGMGHTALIREWVLEKLHHA